MNDSSADTSSVNDAATNAKTEANEGIPDSSSVMERFHESLRSVRNAVDKYKDCSDEEKAKLRKDLD